MHSNRRVIYALDSKMENVIKMEQVPLEMTLWGSLLGHEGWQRLSVTAIDSDLQGCYSQKGTFSRDLSYINIK